MPSEEYKHSLPATPTRMSQRSFKGEGHELGSPNNRTDMSLPSVWRQKSVDVLNRAAIQRKSLAEHRAAYWKYNEEVRRAQYSMQIQVNDALIKKKSTLELLIDKLNSTATAAQPVVKLLHEYKARLEVELSEKVTYLDRNQERSAIRDQRVPSELVADEPQRQLLAQETLLKDAIVQQEKNLKEITETLVQLEASQQELEADMHDKKEAWDLNNQAEQQCVQPTLKLPNIPSKRIDLTQANAVKLDKDVDATYEKVQQEALLSPNVWHGSTMKNIDKSKRIQTRAMGLCDGCELITRKLSEAILQAHHWVAQSLEERLKEQKKLVEELNEQFKLTLEEIHEAETTITMLKQALEDLNEPLKVSEKRLEIHSKRPERELIEDDVQIHLKAELSELRAQKALLEQRKLKVENMLEELCCTRNEISNDVRDKTQAIEIDTRVLEMGSFPERDVR